MNKDISYLIKKLSKEQGREEYEVIRDVVIAENYFRYSKYPNSINTDNKFYRLSVGVVRNQYRKGDGLRKAYMDYVLYKR